MLVSKPWGEYRGTPIDFNSHHPSAPGAVLLYFCAAESGSLYDDFNSKKE